MLHESEGIKSRVGRIGLRSEFVDANAVDPEDIPGDIPGESAGRNAAIGKRNRAGGARVAGRIVVVDVLEFGAIAEVVLALGGHQIGELEPILQVPAITVGEVPHSTVRKRDCWTVVDSPRLVYRQVLLELILVVRDRSLGEPSRSEFTIPVPGDVVATEPEFGELRRRVFDHECIVPLRPERTGGRIPKRRKRQRVFGVHVPVAFAA